MTSQKIYIAFGILFLAAVLAIMGKSSNRTQDITTMYPTTMYPTTNSTIVNVPTIVPGKINEQDALVPGRQIIAGPLLIPDGGILFILEDGEARQIM